MTSSPDSKSARQRRGRSQRAPLQDILVADADATFCRAIGELLKRAGYAVRTAVDGQSARGELDRRLPDLLILSLNLPGLSGFEILRLARQAHTSPGVAALGAAVSGASDKDHPASRPLTCHCPPVLIASTFGFEWEAALVEADGCLHKPLRPEEALSAVDFLLNKNQTCVLH
ncbi:MAG: response regulator transcription factor [Myxococcaceae bacterium]|nr:response regulator transcription factor [Myxococcaceae bacterium]